MNFFYNFKKIREQEKQIKALETLIKNLFDDQDEMTQIYADQHREILRLEQVIKACTRATNIANLTKANNTIKIKVKKG